MRVHETDGKSACFAGDIPDGYVNECGCGGRQDVVDSPSGTPYYCKLKVNGKVCGKEICYRPWCEW